VRPKLLPVPSLRLNTMSAPTTGWLFSLTTPVTGKTAGPPEPPAAPQPATGTQSIANANAANARALFWCEHLTHILVVEPNIA
jgi:hypothetical protein